MLNTPKKECKSKKLCKIEEKNAPFLRKKFINRTKCSNFTNKYEK